MDTTRGGTPRSMGDMGVMSHKLVVTVSVHRPTMVSRVMIEGINQRANWPIDFSPIGVFVACVNDREGEEKESVAFYGFAGAGKGKRQILR